MPPFNEDDRLDDLEADLNLTEPELDKWRIMGEQFATFYFQLYDLDVPEEDALEMTKAAIGAILSSAVMMQSAQDIARAVKKETNDD
jgi:hypothetical protein